VIQYTCGYKYQLHADASFVLPLEFTPHEFDSPYIALFAGTLRIRRGYAWDGPSGPTLDTKDAMQASLVHDALYQAIREGLLPRTLKEAADDMLYSLCRQDGMGRIRAWAWKKAVNHFGLSATIQNKNIMVAP
jgi:hypothetical protein